MQEEIEVVKDRFCIYCGIWFNDEKIYCPNCNQTKVPTAATRDHDLKLPDDVESLVRKLRKDLGVDETENKKP